MHGRNVSGGRSILPESCVYLRASPLSSDSDFNSGAIDGGKILPLICTKMSVADECNRIIFHTSVDSALGFQCAVRSCTRQSLHTGSRRRNVGKLIVTSGRIIVRLLLCGRRGTTTATMMLMMSMAMMMMTTSRCTRPPAVVTEFS